MSRVFLPMFHDEPTELILRYEGYLQGKAPGYFDIHDIGTLADYYINVGLSDRAESVLRLGESLHPNNDVLKTKRAKIYLIESKHQEALDELDAMTEMSDELEVKFMRIESLISLNRLSEAWQITESILAEKDKEFDWICFDLANIYYDVYELSYAKKIINKGLDFNPKNIELLKILGECQKEDFNSHEALDTYLKITKLDPFNLGAWLAIGELYTDDLKYDEALEAFEYAVAIKGDENAFLLEVGTALLNLERYEEAIEKLLLFIEENPKYWLVNNVLADAYSALDDYETALHYYEKAYAEDAKDVKAINGITFSYIGLEDYDKALYFAEIAIQSHPSDIEAWENLGDIYLETHMLENAINAYEKTLSLYAIQPDVAFKLAHIYMDMGMFNKALFYYQKAAIFDPDLEFIELFMAVASFRINNIEEAVFNLKEAIKKNLDAIELFMEFCPDGQEVLKEVLQ